MKSNFLRNLKLLYIVTVAGVSRKVTHPTLNGTIYFFLTCQFQGPRLSIDQFGLKLEGIFSGYQKDLVGGRLANI